jgi:pseudaminic acid cytidylyltransferase
MIAIIPARGGSKRIKNKNIKSFNRRPIIFWSIKTAIKSKIFNKVIVSTDNLKIKKIAQKYGAEVPFLRPKNISGDYATTRDVIKHAMNFYNKNLNKIEDFCCIYPTSPLLNEKTLIRAFKIYKKNKKKKYVFSAVKFSYPVQRGFSIDNKNQVKPIDKKKFGKRSQDLKNVYHDAGQFYFGNTEMLKKNINIFSNKSYPIILSEEIVQDIDTITDWKIAEIKFKNR